MTRSKSFIMVLSKLMGRQLVVREGSLLVLMSLHKVTSFHAVRMYPILSEKVKSLAKWV